MCRIGVSKNHVRLSIQNANKWWCSVAVVCIQPGSSISSCDEQRYQLASPRQYILFVRLVRKLVVDTRRHIYNRTHAHKYCRFDMYTNACTHTHIETCGHLYNIRTNNNQKLNKIFYDKEILCRIQTEKRRRTICTIHINTWTHACVFVYAYNDGDSSFLLVIYSLFAFPNWGLTKLPSLILSRSPSQFYFESNGKWDMCKCHFAGLFELFIVGISCVHVVYVYNVCISSARAFDGIVSSSHPFDWMRKTIENFVVELAIIRIHSHLGESKKSERQCWLDECMEMEIVEKHCDAFESNSLWKSSKKAQLPFKWMSAIPSAFQKNYKALEKLCHISSNYFWFFCKCLSLLWRYLWHSPL